MFKKYNVISFRMPSFPNEKIVDEDRLALLVSEIEYDCQNYEDPRVFKKHSEKFLSRQLGAFAVFCAVSYVLILLFI